ncbi:uncharacterized protein RCO7_11228 [Rhynchosporium graminicola]|uniref:HTH CENPB-type domain-containing protein n=1 Tax=Rhynchosporium graminicola TaxID=2792576 RepID=A0A1E1LB56_9HELO|nr:uncharacterized protein RCO7_11228 [Rhynchosporium commune]
MPVPRSKYYFQSHATKSDYEKAFRDAKLWSIAHPIDRPSKVARQFDIKVNSFTKALTRVRRIEAKGSLKKELFPGSGGHNKLLTALQEEAIIQYCYDHWEVDMGATHLMVKSAIAHLLAAQHPPKPPPSDTWYYKWLRNHPDLHSIKTKPMEAIRVEPHTEEEVIEWFRALEKELLRLNITQGKRVLNMDESGIRGALPYAESVVVPKSKLYVAMERERFQPL